MPREWVVKSPGCVLLRIFGQDLESRSRKGVAGVATKYPLVVRGPNLGDLPFKIFPGVWITMQIPFLVDCISRVRGLGYRLSDQYEL